MDFGRYDGTGTGGDGVCVAAGYNAGSYRMTEGSVGVGASLFLAVRWRWKAV